MSGVWSLELPISEAPPSANARVHWAERAAWARHLRWSTALLVRQGRVPRMDRVDLVVTLHPPDRLRRDSDNYVTTVLKPVKDALVDAGVVADDTDEHVRWRLELADPVGDGRWHYIVELRGAS